MRSVHSIEGESCECVILLKHMLTYCQHQSSPFALAPQVMKPVAKVLLGIKLPGLDIRKPKSSRDELKKEALELKKGNGQVWSSDEHEDLNEELIRFGNPKYTQTLNPLSDEVLKISSESYNELCKLVNEADPGLYSVGLSKIGDKEGMMAHVSSKNEEKWRQR